MFHIKYLFFDFVKLTAAIPGWLFFRPRICYISDKARERIHGGAILISNHEGFSDPILLQFAVWYRRQRFVCAKEIIAGRPFLSLIFKGFRCIAIDRNNFAFASMREIIKALKNGELVSMFPEGHLEVDVNDDGLEQFKSGASLMALSANVPIIPVYIRKPSAVLGRYRIVIGEAIYPGNCDSLAGLSKIDSFTNTLYEEVIKLKKYFDNGGKS